MAEIGKCMWCENEKKKKNQHFIECSFTSVVGFKIIRNFKWITSVNYIQSLKQLKICT